MAVARLLPDGSFDGDFVPSEPGWRIVDFNLAPPPAHDRAYRVALQNGRIVLAGDVAVGLALGGLRPLPRESAASQGNRSG